MTMIMLIMMLKRSLAYHWKYRGSTHRDCNINLKLHHESPVVFHKINNYDPYQKIRKRNRANFYRVILLMHQ